VIGATGRHGGTGARVVERLQTAGRAVRALVRSDDDRAQRLRQSGGANTRRRPARPPNVAAGAGWSRFGVCRISGSRRASWTRWRMWPR